MLFDWYDRLEGLATDGLGWSATITANNVLHVHLNGTEHQFSMNDFCTDLPEYGREGSVKMAETLIFELLRAKGKQETT